MTIQDDGLMVLCAVCDVWQHALCFALLSEKDVPETHICVECSQGKAVSTCTRVHTYYPGHCSSDRHASTNAGRDGCAAADCYAYSGAG